MGAVPPGSEKFTASVVGLTALAALVCVEMEMRGSWISETFQAEGPVRTRQGSWSVGRLLCWENHPCALRCQNAALWVCKVGTGVWGRGGRSLSGGPKVSVSVGYRTVTVTQVPWTLVFPSRGHSLQTH